MFSGLFRRIVSLSVVLAMAFTFFLSVPVAAQPALPDEEPYTWKQLDPRWANVVIGVDPWTDFLGVRHNEETVGHAGCLITAMAILCKLHGVALADGVSITPGTLGTFLYDGGSCSYLTYKGGIYRATSFSAAIPGIRYVDAIANPSDPAGTAEKYLSDPDHVYLLIAMVKGGSHYVSVVGTEGKDVLICDPGHDRSLLSEYGACTFYVYELNPDEAIPDPGLVGETWKVLEKINVRIGPGLSYDKTTYFRADSLITVYETVEADGFLWGKTDSGWCALRVLDGSETYCILIKGAEYTVTYELRYGTGQPEPQTKYKEIPLTLSDLIPVREGYYFLGWSENPDAVAASYTPGSVCKEDHNLHFYDVWMPEDHIFAFGIDVSSHQGKVDWAKVAASGVSFVILRAGTTVGGKDARFEENYIGATAAGLQVGSYFYSSSDTEEGIRNDISAFTASLEGKTFTYPVFLDLENDKQVAIGAEKVTALAAFYLSEMESRGWYGGIYASESWFRSLIDPEAIGGRERIWAARWPGGNRLASDLSDRYAMHQYSETGRVNGISTTVDLNVSFVDFPTLIGEYRFPEPPADDPEDPKDPEDPPVDPPVDDPGDNPGDDPGNPTDDPPVDPPADPPKEPENASPRKDSGLKIEDGYLLGGTTGLTVRDWKELFDGEILVYRGDDVLADDARVVTGCTVQTGDAALVIATRGDVNADGRIDAFDYMIIKSSVLGTIKLNDACYRSGCLLSSSIDAFDYMLLKSYVLGTLKKL